MSFLFQEEKTVFTVLLEQRLLAWFRSCPCHCQGRSSLLQLQQKSAEGGLSQTPTLLAKPSRDPHRLYKVLDVGSA